MGPKEILFAFVVITTVILTESQIPDNLIIVDVRPVFLRENDGMLKCHFNGEPLAVFWHKGPDLVNPTNLVTWFPSPRGVSGSGYESGKYDLEDDFTLVVHDVEDDDAGRYICMISNFKGVILRNYTEATVKNPPQSPFPTIDQCQPEAGATSSCTPTGALTTNLVCRTRGASPGVVSLSWTHEGRPFPSKTTQRSPNQDGVNEDVTVSITANPSVDSYVCVATISSNPRINATASIFVNAVPDIVTTPVLSVLTTDVTGLPSNPFRIKWIVIVIIFFIFVVILLLLIIFLSRRRKRKYELLKPDKRDDTGPISYLELWELIDMCDIATADQIVSKLLNIPERESDSKFEHSKKDLYHELCKWKEESSGDHTCSYLFGAMDELGLDAELNMIKKFRGRTDDNVSDDDLEHICWHIHKCKETVQPILRALYQHKKSKVKLADTLIIPTHSRCDVIKNDFQIMKMWKTDSVSADRDGGDGNDEKEAYRVGFVRKTQTMLHNEKNQTAVSPDGNHDEDGADEETPIMADDSVEVDMKPKTTASNQRVQLCLALEVAGRKVDERDRGIYLQLAKKFFQIKDDFKKELTDDEFKMFALSITKQHCQKLGLSKDDIIARNEEDLTTMFRTDVMLMAWAMEQHCSNYEIRCRLREAAKRCNRNDIADVFIGQDQSQVMVFNDPVPTSLTVSNEKQATQARAFKSNDSNTSDLGTPSEPSLKNDYVIMTDTAPSDATKFADLAESDISNVTAISRDDLERIGRYAGTETLLALGGKYGVTVTEQRSLEGKELINAIIKKLKPVLDSEHDRINKEGRTDTPRNILRGHLQDLQSDCVCLLPRGRSNDIFNVEFIDLAFHLIMKDVYPFAKALGVTDQELTSCRPNFGPTTLGKGTPNILKAVTGLELASRIKILDSGRDRFELAKKLKAAGYSEEGKVIYFGFEIGLGDVVEVESRVDKEFLAKELDFVNDDQTSQVNQTNQDEYYQSVLLRWKNTVHSSSFNSRMVLADAVFAMGERQLALDIISGVYRRRAMIIPVVELLARNIPEERLGDLSKVLKVKEGQTCQEVISCWAAKASNPKNLFSLFKDVKEIPIELSNKLLEAGFYEFAYEIMAGAWQGKEEKKRMVKEGSETGKIHPDASHNDINSTEGDSKKGEEINQEKASKDTEKETDIAATDEIAGQKTSEEVAGESKMETTSPEKEVIHAKNETFEKNDESEPNTKNQGDDHEKEHKKDKRATTNDSVTSNDEGERHDSRDEVVNQTEVIANTSINTENPAGERLGSQKKAWEGEAPLPDSARVEHFSEEIPLDTHSDNHKSKSNVEVSSLGLKELQVRYM